MDDKQIFTLDNHQIKNDSKFSYCPYCWKSKKAEGKTDDVIKGELPKVYYKKLLEITKDKKGDDVKYINEFFICTNCKRQLTSDDYSFMYGLKSDGTRYKDKSEVYHAGAVAK